MNSDCNKICKCCFKEKGKKKELELLFSGKSEEVFTAAMSVMTFGLTSSQALSQPIKYSDSQTDIKSVSKRVTLSLSLSYCFLKSIRCQRTDIWYRYLLHMQLSFVLHFG